MLTSSPKTRPAPSLCLAFLPRIPVFALPFALINHFAPFHEPLDPPDKRPTTSIDMPELSMAGVKLTDPAKPWRLQDHQGHIVLVNYFATWCGPCNQELPELRTLAQQ